MVLKLMENSAHERYQSITGIRADLLRSLSDTEEDGKSPTTIVALTAIAMEEDRQRCMEAGMDEFLTKPLKKEQLTKLVDGLCGGMS